MYIQNFTILYSLLSLCDGFCVGLLLLFSDPLSFLFNVVEQVVKHLKPLNGTNSLFVVHNVLEVEDFDLSWRGKLDFLIIVTREAVLYLVLLLSLLLYFFGEFIFLIDKHADILSQTWL